MTPFQSRIIYEAAWHAAAEGRSIEVDAETGSYRLEGEQWRTPIEAAVLVSDQPLIASADSVKTLRCAIESMVIELPDIRDFRLDYPTL